jgi:uncharacterized protein (TIGR02265 family)
MAASTSASIRWAKTDSWEQELARRTCLATSRDTIRGLLLNGTLEVLQELGGEALVKRGVEASGEARFLDFFSYPVGMHFRMISAALPELVEEYGDSEEALRELGRKVAARFMVTGGSKAMAALSPGSPRRLMSSLPTAYRLAASFGEYSVAWTGPCSGRFVFKGDFLPHPFHEGVMETLLGLGGAREVAVRGRQTGGLENECEFRWQ